MYTFMDNTFGHVRFLPVSPISKDFCVLLRFLFQIVSSK